MAGTHSTPSEETALRLVVEGTASETGAEFFRSLVRNLAAALGTAGAWVTEYRRKEQTLRSLAMWMNGDFAAPLEYPLAGTACQGVVENRTLVHIPEKLIELFPRADGLAPRNAVSYLGAPLLDTDGSVMGHVSVLDTKPMPRDARAISLFQIFAVRAAAEQRRLRIEREVQWREEQLSTLLETALDAILVLDAGLRVVRANQAASRLFGHSASALQGASLEDFLVADSVRRVERFARELEARPGGQQQLWVPQDFAARRRDASIFPAEATLSRFENRGQAYFTLILRNTDERVEAEKQIQLLMQDVEHLREAVREMPGQDALLGRSPGMQSLIAAIQQVAKTEATVLVTGETGTGKELVARAIHEASARRDKPLVRVNCAAIPGTLMESEFFGHERGAFTGATSKREGRFALADGGTIFLDEVGELPLDLQAKLLRVLQEGEFEPLGSARTRKVSVRVVAATNRDLAAMVAEAKFREDLFYRLNVFPVRVPPLRERGADVALLARVLVERLARRMGRRLEPLHPDDLRRLQAYSWPGNVRELQNVIERAIILSTSSRLELERALPGAAAPAIPPTASAAEAPPRILTASELAALERANLERALAAAGGKISGEGGAAQRLGLPPSTLTSRLKALGMLRPGR
jgi:PAS domain S-box-containing protein